MVEHSTADREVAGSSPAVPSLFFSYVPPAPGKTSLLEGQKGDPLIGRKSSEKAVWPVECVGKRELPGIEPEDNNEDLWLRTFSQLQRSKGGCLSHPARQRTKQKGEERLSSVVATRDSFLRVPTEYVSTVTNNGRVGASYDVLNFLRGVAPLFPCM